MRQVTNTTNMALAPSILRFLSTCFVFGISTHAFQVSRGHISRWQHSLSSTHSPSDLAAAENDEMQWDLLKKHHLGSWKGVWTTYDSMGDVVLESIASVDLQQTEEEQINVSHTIVQGATRSNCATCFDSMDSKTIPVASYMPDNLLTRKVKLGSNGMVIGPSLLRSGAMATELILSYRGSRIRAIFQHAPVWEKAASQSGPPDGLKLFRVLVSREISGDGPPDPKESSLFRPIPPFMWHKEWSGTSWTWGPEAGDRGWSVNSLEESDTWHGSAPPEVWNLRLPGGVFVQSPRVLHQGGVGLLRLAWLLPDEMLLRVESGVQVLEPMALDNDDVVGFAPPSLSTYRCDVLEQLGDLEGQPSFVEDSRLEQEKRDSAKKSIPTTTAKPVDVSVKKPTSSNEDDEDSGLQAIRDAMQL